MLKVRRVMAPKFIFHVVFDREILRVTIFISLKKFQ